MPIMIAIPDECKPLAEAVERLVVCTERAMHRAAGGRAVDYGQIERDVGERAAEVERAAHQRILTALDVDAPAVVIDGRVHTRVHRDDGRYYTLAGDVVVTRSLYRAERNGKVVDPVSLRTGAVEGGWLPDTAAAMAHLLRTGAAGAASSAGRFGSFSMTMVFAGLARAVGAASAALVAHFLFTNCSIWSTFACISFCLPWSRRRASTAQIIAKRGTPPKRAATRIASIRAPSSPGMQNSSQWSLPPIRARKLPVTPAG